MIEPFYNSLWVILEWQNILAMVVGVIGGIIFGAIPGLTATMGIALLIPLTFGMSPLMALGMMAGIHNGGSYGGAIPAVLLRIPGTPGAIATTFDGYPMAQQGLAERALKIACVSSAVGGMVSAVSLMILSPPLAEFALAFGPPEIFWISLFGLSSIAVLLGSDPIKGLMASCIGLVLGMVGLDHVTGYERFTFDTLELSAGLQLIVIMVGVYALPPAFQMAERAIMTGVKSKDLEFKGKSDMSNWPWAQIFPAWIRANVIGIIIGILPGVGGVVGAFIAYNETKRSSKDPESFGKGNPVGVAVAECANNADNAAAMIPGAHAGGSRQRAGRPDTSGPFDPRTRTRPALVQGSAGRGVRLHVGDAVHLRFFVRVRGHHRDEAVRQHLAAGAGSIDAAHHRADGGGDLFVREQHLQCIPDAGVRLVRLCPGAAEVSHRPPDPRAHPGSKSRVQPQGFASPVAG